MSVPEERIENPRYFKREVIAAAWKRSRQRCECRRVTHDHERTRCGVPLIWENRRQPDVSGHWEANHRRWRMSRGRDSLANCELLCLECHEAAR
jgi:hypothetical protein